MIRLQCYAMITDKDVRKKLVDDLKRRSIPHLETNDKVSVEANFLSYRQVERIIELFESTGAVERGFSMLGKKDEVMYDSG